MPRRVTLSRVLPAALSIAAFAGVAAAQTTGDIRGQVRDANGEGLPGVMVTATIEDRGVSRTTISGVGGNFVISSLQVDDYVVTAALDGFQDHRVEGVRVSIAATVNLEIALGLEAVEEEVTVTASPILDVTSSSVSTSFTADFIEDLPTDRNFWDLVAGVARHQPGLRGQHFADRLRFERCLELLAHRWPGHDLLGHWSRVLVDEPGDHRGGAGAGNRCSGGVRKHVGGRNQHRDQVRYERSPRHGRLVPHERRSDGRERRDRRPAVSSRGVRRPDGHARRSAGAGQGLVLRFDSVYGGRVRRAGGRSDLPHRLPDGALRHQAQRGLQRQQPDGGEVPL